MGAKKKAAMVGVPIAVLLTVIGGMSLNFDFSETTTNIGQIGDNVINNYISDTLGIDVTKYKENCAAGVYDNNPAGQYCDLVP